MFISVFMSVFISVFMSVFMSMFISVFISVVWTPCGLFTFTGQSISQAIRLFILTFLVRGSAFGVPVDADRPRCRQTRTPGGRVRVGARPLESMGAAGQRDQLVIFEQ